MKIRKNVGECEKEKIDKKEIEKEKDEKEKRRILIKNLIIKVILKNRLWRKKWEDWGRL